MFEYLRRWSDGAKCLWTLDTMSGDVKQLGTKDVFVVEPPDGIDITDWAARGVDWTRKLVGGPAERRHRDLSHTSPSTETDIDFGPRPVTSADYRVPPNGTLVSLDQRGGSGLGDTAEGSSVPVPHSVREQ